MPISEQSPSTTGFSSSMKAATPVAIGGVGGSGTRLIAQCLRELGYFIGSDLNESNDNLLFTLLFKQTDILASSDARFRELLKIFYQGMTGEGSLSSAQVKLVNTLAGERRHKLTVNWLEERVKALCEFDGGQYTAEQLNNWGWKEPTTHVVLDRLLKYIPGMKYIHVVRNGLDMAYSENQNQLNWWGRYFLDEEVELSPKYSLRYWCVVHERVLRIGESMGDNFLFLNYDDFCTDREVGIRTLCDFLAVPDNGLSVNLRLLDLIATPGSIGRYKNHDISVFDESDVRYVEQLGFETGG